MTIKNAINEVKKNLPSEIRIHPSVATAVRTLVEYAEYGQGWRSALAQLPPIGEAVILYSANKYGVRQGTHGGDAGWHDIFGNTAGNVTHWMPLPSEPTV